MPPIDLTNMSYHAQEERKNRLTFIKALGIGVPVATVEKKDEQGRKYYKTLTSTGVMVIRNTDNMIITLYLAGINQAIQVFRESYGRVRMPEELYNKILMNEIMFPAA